MNTHKPKPILLTLALFFSIAAAGQSHVITLKYMDRNYVQYILIVGSKETLTADKGVVVVPDSTYNRYQNSTYEIKLTERHAMASYQPYLFNDGYSYLGLKGSPLAELFKTAQPVYVIHRNTTNMNGKGRKSGL